MPPYPLIPCPEWWEMRQRLIDNYDVTVRRVPCPAVSGLLEGELLERQVDGKLKQIPIPLILRPDERVRPPVIKSICTSLKIPPADFGLTLDYLE